MDKTMLPS